MKNHRVSRPWRAVILSLATAASVVPFTASAQQPRVRVAPQVQPRDCQCVDDAGNPISNCVCVRRNDGTGGNATVTFFGSSARARIGVSLEEATNGARVVEVRDGSPAAAAGLQAGDIITRIGNQSLTTALPNANRERTATRGDDPAVQRLMSLAQEWEPGQSVAIEYLRGTDRRTINVTTEEVPPEERLMGRAFGLDNGQLRLMEPFRFDGMIDSVRTFRFRADSLGADFPGIIFRADSLGNRARSRVVNIGRGCGGTMVLGFGDQSCIDGVQMVELNAQLGEYFGANSGVLVTEAPENSSLGLRSGDVILQIGGRNVADPMAAVRMLGSYSPNEDVPLRVMRKNQQIEIRGLRPPR